MGALSFEFALKPTGEGLLWALWKVSTSRETGVLSIEWERFRKQIVFKRGDPILTKSNWPQEAFGSFLVRKKLVTQDLINSEIKERDQAGLQTPLGEWLVQKGHLQGAQMPSILEGHFRERIFNLISLSHGKISFSPRGEDFNVETSIVPLTESFPKLLWDATKMLFTPSVCRGKLAPYLARTGKVLTQFPLPLMPQELRIWNGLVGKDTLIEGLDEMSLKLMAAGSEFGCIQWGDNLDEKLMKEMRELEKKIEKATPHEILEVPRDASVETCKKSFLGLVKKYHPDRLPPSSGAELKAMSEGIFSKINEAYAMMTDPEKRKEYEAHLEIQKAGGMDHIHEKLQAEMLIAQAKMSLKRRHFKGALDMLEEIGKVLKNDSEVMADRVYAEMMWMLETKSDMNSKYSSWKSELDKALAIKSDNAAALFYRGLIFRFEGNVNKALADFDAALEIDPRLAEASSEARVLRMRQQKEKSSSGFFKKK